jgi:hypothetical protein
MRGQLLVVCTDTWIEPAALVEALTQALARDPAGGNVVRVLIPAVLPPTLPVGAWPAPMARRLERLREAAEAVVAGGGAAGPGARPAGAPGAAGRAPGRVEITACRSVPDLLAAAWPVDALVLVGRAGWRVRRAARRLAPDIVVIPSRRARREPLPASRPKVIPQ